MRSILPSPDTLTREEFLDAFKKELQKSIKDQKMTVRFIGHTLFIEVNGSPQVILDAIFVPLLDHQPRWEMTYTGWHHLFINRRTWSTDYADLLNKITPKSHVSTKLANQKQRRTVSALHPG
jgi:hypothetical protein